MLVDRAQEVLESATEEDIAFAVYMSERLKQMEHQIAQCFKISYDEYQNIMCGDVVVDHITYVKRSHRKWRTLARRVGIAVMAILLVLCLSVQGMADSLRNAILRIFTDKTPIHVTSSFYNRYDDLHGCIVPTVLPCGYEILYYARAANNVLLITYENKEGQQIKYFCYPKGVLANQNNKCAEDHSIETKFGIAHVCHSGSKQAVYLSIDDANVEMYFDLVLIDEEIRYIIEGMTCIR